MGSSSFCSPLPLPLPPSSLTLHHPSLPLSPSQVFVFGKDATPIRNEVLDEMLFQSKIAMLDGMSVPPIDLRGGLLVTDHVK